MLNKNIKLPFPSDKQPALRVRAMPNDANASGDIFGGWLMSQIDIAGAIIAWEYARGPVATVAVNKLNFLKPIFVYDLVSFYPEIAQVGNTSITVDIETYVQRFDNPTQVIKVSEATLVYVAVSKPGVKRKLPARQL